MPPGVTTAVLKLPDVTISVASVERSAERLACGSAAYMVCVDVSDAVTAARAADDVAPGDGVAAGVALPFGTGVPCAIGVSVLLPPLQPTAPQTATMPNQGSDRRRRDDDDEPTSRCTIFTLKARMVKVAPEQS
jgi:hypothetical protein